MLTFNYIFVILCLLIYYSFIPVNYQIQNYLSILSRNVHFLLGLHVQRDLLRFSESDSRKAL